ncbi:uncharacterized protein LOC134822640 [Bolinopsis microptera]|uniref:uncharacterized protein LOC134822640 n=1 Tax=Bolinopsis microptera TaxID=2820187 RepID=UPI00307AF4DB
MMKVLVLALCLTTVWSLQCYHCDTKEDDVTACGKSVCNGLKAVCYKREYSFDDEDEEQYEERGCVEDEKFLDGTCDTTLDTLMDDVDSCKIYTCADNRCNSSNTFAASVSLLSVLIASILL